MSFELSASLRSLLETIEHFERGEVGVEIVQAAVRSAEDSVTEYEMRKLRRFLQSADGNLEFIQFTVESEDVFAEALKVARDVDSEVRRVFGLPGSD